MVGIILALFSLFIKKAAPIDFGRGKKDSTISFQIKYGGCTKKWLPYEKT